MPEIFRKKFHPTPKTPCPVLAILAYALQRLFRCFFPVGMGFGIKFIRITDELFFQSLRIIILYGYRQALRCDFFSRKPRAGMTLAHPGMERKSFRTQHLRPEITVANIRCVSRTQNTGSVGMQNADIMQQSCFFQKCLVQIQFRMECCNFQATVGHLAAMNP